MNPSTPIAKLNKVGKVTAKRLEHLGIYTALDLLYFFPFRYEDFSQIKAVKDLVSGEFVTVKGKVELLANKRSWKTRKIITEALVSDGSGSVRVVWFNQPFLAKAINIGEEIFLSGKVNSDMIGAQLVSPSYEKANKTETSHTARLVPIYPTTDGLTQKQIRFLVTQILDLTEKIKEWLPTEVLEKYDLAPLGMALRGIHYPVDEIDLRKSTERLKFGELFLLQLKAELSRREKMVTPAPVLLFKEKEIQELVNSLPFTLTKTQKISAWEILRDMTKSNSMNRLLSGDVGSGKTVVAAMCSYNAVLNNYQSVIMAPTEILAVQHYNSLVKLLGEKVRVGLLTNSKHEVFYKNDLSFLRKQEPMSKKAQKKEFLDKIKNREVDILVGTHALLTESVEFAKLGFVVVDEQHRFGVSHRKTIKEKGRGTHFLSMTATPIPRSLALMIYGDLDVSIINELPAGRKPIMTRLVESINRLKAYEFIRAQIKQGRQAFVICPMIQSQSVIPAKAGIQVGGVHNDSLIDKKTVLSEYKKLTEEVFPDLSVGFLHGKMPGEEKEAIMESFKNNKLNILVSTSVVEVGVDIPNASVMIIEDADRFGLAQLHQFRGRVGRSCHQSYCLLFTNNTTLKVEDRLKFFEKTLDGFKLAEKDLEVRGPGEVYGTSQSGMMQLRLAKLTDTEIIKKSRDVAKDLAPNLDKYPSIVNKIKEWESSVHLE